jgi:single-strand DNA-binding protein
MAKDINNLTIVGRATYDAKVSTTASGISFSKFAIAVNGFKEGEVSFFNCIMWGKLAENLSKYITKGKQCCYTGEIEQLKWQDRNTGENRYGFQIKILQVQFLSSPKNSSNEAKHTEELFNSPDTFDNDLAF